MTRTAILASAAVLMLGACGGTDEGREANQAAAPADVDVLPPDESVATDSDDLVSGAVDNRAEGGAGENAVENGMPAQ
jgi:ABC-type glycerol-3-phosphate transport system substrate-binding protein